MKLSLVIPCYNEAKNLPLLLSRCGAVAEHGAEVVLVDNGSGDETPSLLREYLPLYQGCRSIRVDVNQGFGFGVLAGLAVSQGDVLAWTHADMQTDPMDAIKGLEFFKHASEPERVFVKGRRYGRLPSDVIFTIGMSVFETLLLGRLLWDINAQPVMFHRRFFESWNDPPKDFALELFAYYCARAANLKIKRFPVLFAERHAGVSSWNVNLPAKMKFIRRTIESSLQLRRRIGRN